MYRLVAWGCITMAVVAALTYILMGLGVLVPGNLETGEGGFMPYLIGAAYLIMGVLIVSKWRWIKIASAAIVLITIIGFYAMYTDQPDVMWSAPGIITKIAQLLMLAGLIYLIVKSRAPKNADVK
jgi:hypothetical protein